MLFSKVIERPTESLIYMERYVNKGSPSGYTFIRTPSEHYAPLTGLENFLLPYYVFPRNEVQIFGEQELDLGLLSSEFEQVPFPVHPDMINNFFGELKLQEFSREKIHGCLKVVPTANGRTVYTVGLAHPFYIKLHYEGILGRVLRGLPRNKAVAGPEISQEIGECVEKHLAPSCFAFLREYEARVKICTSKKLPEVGVVFRGVRPYPYYGKRALLPFFSLFSPDVRSPDDPLLLTQILSRVQNPIETLMSKIVEPILCCYKFLAFDRGLIPEINAQNILLEIDQSGYPTRIVHRDLQGYHKDFSIRRAKGLPLYFESFPYRCIDETTTYYHKRHSYCYDFKLGCYIFDELLEIAERNFGQQKSKLASRIADMFHEITGGQDQMHFNPIDKWYAYDKQETLLAGETPYKQLDHPKYRIA